MYPRLKDLREDHDLKQEAVAQILCINRVQYCRYETGTNEIPVRHLVTLARYYNVSMDYLTGLINTPQPLRKTAVKSKKGKSSVILFEENGSAARRLITAKQLMLLKLFIQNL